MPVTMPIDVNLRTSASDGFFSSIFVVPKKDGGWRPVINLKALNHSIPHFKMESITLLKDIIRKGDFMGRLDLKDAYLTVPVVSTHWRFLRFRWKGRNYEFRTLPFGLASAPSNRNTLLPRVRDQHQKIDLRANSEDRVPRLLSRRCENAPSSSPKRK